jgi:cytochrome c oxidase subunit 2
VIIIVVVGMGLGLSGCASIELPDFSRIDLSPSTPATPSSLAPQGPAASQIALLWWMLFGMGLAVYVLFSVLLLASLLRRRRHVEDETSDDLKRIPARISNKWIISGGVVLPSVVLTVVMAATVWVMRPVTALPPAGALTIEVTGYQWWWSVRYPDQQFVTANEIHIPVGRPVSIKLTSADVIHSFWVPELHGKLDMMPGRTHTLLLQADRPGEYRGLCAEYCGMQHAKMAFLVIAQTPEQFDAWVANQQQPGAEPVDALAIQGRQVFLGSACVYCHAIRGTPANADVGPDLTHLASRRTLAAATVPNTRGHLAGWVVDPQNIKPGNEMPPSDLKAEELHALLAYLESLR